LRVYQTLFNDHLEWVHAAPTTITAYSLAVRLTSGEPSYRNREGLWLLATGVAMALAQERWQLTRLIASAPEACILSNSAP
jgi:hypothetical protein